MKKHQLLVFLFSTIFYFSCGSVDDITENEDYKLKTESAKALVTENNNFAFYFFNKVAESEDKENYMVSPVSLSLALGMVYNGANNETKTAFDDVLHYNAGLLEINKFNKNLINKLSSSTDGSVLEIANSIWIKNNFAVKDEFVRLNKDYFSATVKNLDFNDPASVDIINNWVSDKTHKKIPTIIDVINSKDVLFLINALYFNANWKHKFDPNKTELAAFYKSGSETVQAQMMNITEKIPYFSNGIFSSIILPYEKDKFSMVILLPNEQKSTKDIIDSLNNENWMGWLGNYNSSKINLTIPKFKLNYENTLNDELSAMGLGVAFSDSADFSKISDKRLQITSVLQKTFIDVNEKGTEASAATSISIGFTSIGDPPSFIVNRPFIYLIKENLTGSICFIGKVGSPEYED